MSFIVKIIYKVALLSICVALCISGKTHAAVVHVFEQTSAAGSITQLSDTTLDTGATYNTQEAPRIDGYIFTHWSIAQNQEITDRDEWGRSLDSASYMLYEETTLTANYLAESVDTDSDGVADGYELYWYGDLDEVLLSDTDKDGYTFAQEIAYGSNPLFPDEHRFGVVFYKDSDLLLYNPNQYAPYIIRSEPEGELFATIEAYAAPGKVITTEAYDPNTSNFAYWTKNGVRQEDEWGVASNSVSFVATDKEITEVVAVCEKDELLRMAKYYYGNSASADSDTDKDSYTFAQEIAYGLNPLFPDAHGFGVVFYKDSDLLLYNPNQYAPYIIRSEPEGELFATIEAYAAPGEVITTEAYDPNTSNFAYWTKNGVRQEDEWGVASNSVSFVATENDTIEIVAVSEGDEVARFAFYYYDEATASNSDTDKDGYTFEQEIAYGTNPLFPDEHGFGGVFYKDSNNLEVNLQPFDQLVFTQIDGELKEFFYSNFAKNEDTAPFFGKNASPISVDFDKDGLLDLFVAVSGGFYAYKNIGEIGQPNFTNITKTWELNTIAEALSDIDDPVIAADDDGIYLAGEPIKYFSFDGNITTCSISGIAMSVYDNNLYTLSADGSVYIYLGDTLKKVSFDEKIISGISLSVSDLNYDKIPDMLITDIDGRIWYYKGESSESFTLQHKIWGYSYDGFAENLKLDIVDWDDDGDMDAICGLANGRLMLLRDQTFESIYNVSFNANGGEGVMHNQQFMFGIVQALSTNSYVRKGYKFLGWSTSASGNVEYLDCENVVNLAIGGILTVELYAVWEPNTYSVRFNANGGEGEMKPQRFETNEAKALSKNTFTLEGYKFVGWGIKSEYLVVDLSDGTNAASYPVTTLSNVPDGGWTDEYKTTKLVLRKITAGKMPRTDVDITLTKDYYVGVFELTQKQWELVMGSNPSWFWDIPTYFDEDTRPVEMVSYDDIRGTNNGSQWPASNAVDATSFMGKLRVKTGIDFDLPTEAQWEYACRAGSLGDYGLLADGTMGTIDAMGWYGYGQTHVVGTKTPNAWGLYDMHGNVWEWCLDWYSSSGCSGTDPVGATSGYDRVIRGGSWYAYYSGGSLVCRSSSRVLVSPDTRENDFGLRVAATDVIIPTLSYTEEQVVSNLSYKDGDIVDLYAVWELNRTFIEGEDGDYIISGYTNVYDGAAHGLSISVMDSINANITYSIDGNTFISEMPLFTNVCEQTVWYKLEAEGYLPMTNMAQVIIKPRPVTLTSGSASKIYDGTPLTKHEVAVSGDGFVAGEGASYAYTGSQTAAGSSDNAFSYTLNANTLASNYVITTVNGKLTITQSVIKPEDIFGSDPAETPLSCEKTYNGVAQSVEVVPEFDEEYTFLWSLNGENESSYLETAPTLKNVADGDLLVYFKMVTANFEPYYGKVIFKILPKELTEDMVVLTDEAFFFDPDSGQKTPSVTVADKLADGTVISTTADYEIAYGDSTSAGAIPVIVTAKNNYIGQITKTFDVLKRPVAPPVIGAKAYNGRTQKATITTDSRWKVVENNGGINAGEYDVILRLTNTSDYMWKGLDNDAAEWTGVFVIRKGNNGWSRYPGINSWTSGETPSEPVGQPRYGELSIAYRRVGASIATETVTKPTTPGKYIARFWVDETDNFIGVATTEPYYEVEFEIYQGEGDVVNTHTQTTGIPVHYTWLEPYLEKYGSGDYEIAGNAKGANGYYLWESYLVGLDPEDPTSRFLANIEILPDGMPKVSWMPDLSEAEEPRTYTVWGKEKFDDEEWTPVTSENKDKQHFFKITVEME